MLESLKKWMGQRGVNVLLAEDDDEMRDLLATALRKDGHQVTEVADGGRLLAYLQAAAVKGDLWPMPDILVSDVRMPGFSGLDVLDALRTAEVHIPVVLISAFGDRETHDRAFNLGAAMLDKPFDIEQLRLTVNLLVGAAA
jgi:CheY-like chemotaxis protein